MLVQLFRGVVKCGYVIISKQIVGQRSLLGGVCQGRLYCILLEVWCDNCYLFKKYFIFCIITVQDQVKIAEYWPYLQPANDINDLTRKHDLDLPYNCQQLDAKTIFLVDMYNFVCNDQFYCCAPAKRTIANNSPNANYL